MQYTKRLVPAKNHVQNYCTFLCDGKRFVYKIKIMIQNEPFFEVIFVMFFMYNPNLNKSIEIHFFLIVQCTQQNYTVCPQPPHAPSPITFIYKFCFLIFLASPFIRIFDSVKKRLCSIFLVTLYPFKAPTLCEHSFK